MHKDKFKMDQRHKCKVGHCKPLRRKHRQTVFDINQSKIFIDPPSRIIKIKTKTDKWDLIKLKNFCTAKEIINKKTTHRIGENICKQLTRD